VTSAFLFVFSRPPHSSLHVLEMLDMTLIAAAFDQNVSLLLIDDGVYSLRVGQKPESRECRDVSAIFDSLEIYDIDSVYVEQESLAGRGLWSGDLGLAVDILPRSDVGALMRRQTVIVNV